MSRGRQLNATNTKRVADGLILWSFHHAGLAGGSSEWLGRRLGGQGDLAARNDLLSASLSSSSLSSLSLLICTVFSSRAAGCKLAALILRGRQSPKWWPRVFETVCRNANLSPELDGLRPS